MDLQCNFAIKETDSYICRPLKLNAITSPGTEIVIQGSHQVNKSNTNVNHFICEYVRLSYLPRGLNAHLPNLTFLSIEKCELKEISRKDLFGLEKLERLNLRCNSLSMLPDDLFNGLTKLKNINISLNKITRASSKLFLPLRQSDLQDVNFAANPTINDCYIKGEYNTIENLLKNIDEKCEPPFKMFTESHSKAFGKLFKTGKLSDFTIKVGVDGTFKVHKSILAIQSPVFDTMFDSKMQENVSGKMIIPDFSAGAVDDFLHFIYNGEVRSFSNAMELFVLAEKYQVPALKEISENIIEDRLNESNALEIFNLGQRYDSDRLKRSALKKIGNFIKVHLKDDFLDHPEKVQQLVTAHKEILNLKRKFEDLCVVPNK